MFVDKKKITFLLIFFLLDFIVNRVFHLPILDNLFSRRYYTFLRVYNVFISFMYLDFRSFAFSFFFV